MKLVRVLIIALGLMTIAATASFASVPFVTTSTVNEMAVNAQTGLAGNIQLTALASGTVSAGETILVSFTGGTISSLSDFQAVMVIAGVTAPNGTTTGPTGAVNAFNVNFPFNNGAPIAGPPTIKVASTYLLITFPAQVLFNFGDNIEIIGPRFNVAPAGAAVVGGQISAFIASGLGSATVTNQIVQVANFVNPISVAVGAIAQFSTAGFALVPPTTTSTGVVKITELYPNMFETKGVSSALNGSETQLLVRISNIPTGISLVAAATGATGQSGGLLAAQVVPGSVAQSGSTATFTVAIQNQDSTANETIAVNCTFAVNAGAALPIPLPPPATTVAVTLGPVITGVPPIVVGGPNSPLRYYPVYVPSPEATILTVVQLTTQLLAQFNSWVPGYFDTGIAIQNTTGFTTSFTQPLGNVAAQSGDILAVFYPADGSASKSIDTLSSTFTLKGQGGLDANGNLAPHATWTILLSQLAAQAGFTSGFTGQIYFLTMFTNAHGINYIADSNFKVQAQGYPMLVVPSTIGANGRIFGTAGAPESLGN